MDPRFSNYPRANMGPGGPGGGGYGISQRPPGAHFEFISDAFNIIRADLGTWVAAVLLTLLVIAASIAPFYAAMLATMFSGPGPNTAMEAASIGVSILMYAVLLTVMYFTYLGLGLMGMQAARGERPQIGELFAPFRRFIPVMLTCLVLSFLTLLGFALCFVPGLIVFGLFSLAPFAAYEQEMSPGDALRWSMENSRPHMWGIIALGIVAYVIAQLGTCLCYVGYLFTGAVPAIVLGLTYMSFRNPPPAPFMPYPPSGPIPPYEPPTESAPPAPGV